MFLNMEISESIMNDEWNESIMTEYIYIYIIMYIYIYIYNEWRYNDRMMASYTN